VERNLRTLGVGALVRSFGSSMMAPFFVLYLHNVLDVGYIEVGELAVALGVGPLLLSSVGGLLADRIGRRRVFLASLGGEAVCLLGTAAAMHAASLVLVLLAFGSFNIVATLSGPALSAYIADFAVGSARTQGFTAYRVAQNSGFTLGTLVGGSFVGLFGFIPVATAAAVCSGTTAIFVALALDPSPFDLRLAESGRLGAPGPSSPRAGSVRASLRILAHDRTFLVLCLAFALAGMVAAQWQLTFPLFAVGRLGISYAVLGLGLATNGLIVVFGQTAMTNGLLGRRHTTIAIFGTAAYATGFLVLGAADEFAVMPLLGFFAAVLVLTVGENLLFIPQSTLASNVAPPAEVGGIVLASVANPLLMWAILVIPLVPATLLLRWLGRRIPREADRA
jgi:MFS family permease